MLKKLREWLFHGVPDPVPSGPPTRKFERSPLMFGPEPDDLSWFCPPATVSDPAAWDVYWRAQVAHGVVGFVDMFCHDGWLVDAVRSCGLRSILCVGAGVSAEPRALSAAGFDVTVLDLSPVAVDLASRIDPPLEFLSRVLEDRPFAEGGTLTCVAGDLRDSAICAGPYDVVIERKTLQLFRGEEHAAGIAAVAQRLAERGIFFSHAHNGGWKPPQPRIHPNERWFSERNWEAWEGPPLNGRAVHLFFTTG